MKPIRRAIETALFAITALALLAPEAAAQGVQQPEPPVVIGGFKYEYLPRGNIHKFHCAAQECVPGSKVSYTIYAPEKNPDFERFRKDAQQIASYLEARLPPGATLALGAQEKSEEPLVTTFESSRVLQRANGVEEVTLSTVAFTANFTISVISSAENRGNRRRNNALFLLGLLTWSGAVKQ